MYVERITPADEQVTVDSSPSDPLGNDGESIYDPVVYLNKIHSGKKNLSITHLSFESKVLNMTRFSQTALNNAYNNEHSTSIGGSCGNVSMSTLTYYFNWRLANYPNLPDNINDIFEEYVIMTGGTGSGGSAASYQTTLEIFFSRYGYNMDGIRYTNGSTIKTKMIQEIDGNRVSIISVWDSPPYSAHAMVVMGYQKYRISYKNWLGITINKTETMYCIDEGWGRSSYAYIHEEYMPATYELTIIYRSQA